RQAGGIRRVLAAQEALATLWVDRRAELERHCLSRLQGHDLVVLVEPAFRDVDGVRAGENPFPEVARTGKQRPTGVHRELGIRLLALDLQFGQLLFEVRYRLLRLLVFLWILQRGRSVRRGRDQLIMAFERDEQFE